MDYVRKWSLDTALQYIRSTPMRSVSGSSELNHTYGKIVESMTQGLIPESTVDTKLKMEGLMVAYSLTMNYKILLPLSIPAATESVPS